MSSHKAAYLVAPVIISTRAATTDFQDECAELIRTAAQGAGFAVRPEVVIPDGEAVLAVLSELLTQVSPQVIITSGGTGISPDDRTPEFTQALLDYEIPGLMQALRAEGMKYTPYAALSRAVAGVAEGTIIVNLPGSPRAVQQLLPLLMQLLPHMCRQLQGHKDHQEKDHQEKDRKDHGKDAGEPEPAAQNKSTVVHAQISQQPIHTAAAEEAVRSPACGAVVSFAGVVRNHDGGQSVTGLSYSQHPQAAEIIAQIADDVAQNHPGVRLWVSHRVGQLQIGEEALVVAVASAHRQAAFNACSALVDTIKERLPIWKEQFFADGSCQWVGIAEGEH